MTSSEPSGLRVLLSDRNQPCTRVGLGRRCAALKTLG